jgi:hypothetical protein
MRRVEIRAAQIGDLAGLPQLGEPACHLEPFRRVVVPPVELDEVEPLDAQAPQRLVDDGLDIGLADAMQQVEVGHAFGVDVDGAERLGAAQVAIAHPEPADQVLHAGVDVGAVEGDDAAIGEGDHVLDRRRGIDRSVPAGHLPTAADDPRNHVAWREFEGLHHGLIGRAAGRAWFRRG